MQLAPHDFIARACIACHVDTPHIHSPARINKNTECHLLFLAVDLRCRIGIGERISFVTEPVLDFLG